MTLAQAVESLYRSGRGQLHTCLLSASWVAVIQCRCWSGSSAAQPSFLVNLSNDDRAKPGCLLKLAGFILVNLAASWRKSSTSLASDPPSCATSCNVLSATSTLNLTASSEAAVRYLVPNHYTADMLC